MRKQSITGSDYFLIVVSFGVITVVSFGDITVVSFGTITVVSVVVFFVVSVVVSDVLSPLLQAAKLTETIANAKITFFIFLICLIFKNYNFRYLYPDRQKVTRIF
jgi:hypothetical protein